MTYTFVWPTTKHSCPGPGVLSPSNFSALAITSSQQYRSDLRCTATLRGVNGGEPALRFTAFSTELDHDYVFLYDGDNSAAPLLGWYTGTQLAGQLVVGRSGALGNLCTDRAY